jgi:hypothetical protein
MICASEQSVVVVDAVYERVRDEFEKRGAYFLSADQTKAAGKIMILEGGRLNVDIVRAPPSLGGGGGCAVRHCLCPRISVRC